MNYISQEDYIAECVGMVRAYSNCNNIKQHILHSVMWSGNYVIQTHIKWLIEDTISGGYREYRINRVRVLV